MRRVPIIFSLALLAGGAAAQTPTAPNFVPVPDNAILSSNVSGLAVTNKANEKVGQITDLVVESGRLAGYVLSVGGFLGIGTHHVVISPSGVIIAFDAQTKSWRARIDATKEQLKAAPQFVYEGRWAK